MATAQIPTTGLSEYISVLAQRSGVRYVPTPTDNLANIITKLSGDEILVDEIEDLLVALKRAKVIDGLTMVHLLGNYLEEKHGRI